MSKRTGAAYAAARSDINGLSAIAIQTARKAGRRIASASLHRRICRAVSCAIYSGARATMARATGAENGISANPLLCSGRETNQNAGRRFAAYAAVNPSTTKSLLAGASNRASIVILSSPSTAPTKARTMAETSGAAGGAGAGAKVRRAAQTSVAFKVRATSPDLNT